MTGGARRNVAAGAVAWIVFCGAVVAVRGVRWDETYEFAQVILGTVRPPAGHPLVPYVRNAFSLQVYSSALLLWATGSALAVNAFRNFLFIAATVMPAYLLGARLSGRALYGHAAALLVLAGAHLELRSTYPQFVWPDIFSNGHIGTAWALLAVACFASQWWRAGFLLLGMMPCIHVGQAPPVLLLGGAVGMWLACTGRRRELARGWAFFGIGLAVCGAFGLAQRPFIVEAATTGPYSVTGDVDGIWRSFVAFHDIHRAWPPVNGQVGLGLLVAISGLMAYGTWKQRKDARGDARKEAGEDGTAWAVVFVYAAGIGTIVWSTMALHAAMGPETPRILLQWMPYRLLNHAPPLLLATVCGVLGGGRRLRWVPLVVLALAAALPYTRDMWPEAVYARYLAPSAGLVYVLVGAAFFSAGVAAFGRKTPAMLATLVAACVLACFHQFGAACFAAGALAGLALTGRGETGVGARRLAGGMAAAVLLIAAGVFLRQQWLQHQTLPVGGFEKSVRAYLAARGEGDAMLAGPPKQLLLQAKTNHAVITDMALPYMITYLPSIGPAVNKLFEDVYGICLTDPGSGDWERAWAERPVARWRELGALYGFGYVVAPASLQLDLPLCLKTSTDALYRVGGL